MKSDLNPIQLGKRVIVSGIAALLVCPVSLLPASIFDAIGSGKFTHLRVIVLWLLMFASLESSRFYLRALKSGIEQSRWPSDVVESARSFVTSEQFALAINVFRGGWVLVGSLAFFSGGSFWPAVAFLPGMAAMGGLRANIPPRPPDEVRYWDAPKQLHSDQWSQPRSS